MWFLSEQLLADGNSCQTVGPCILSSDSRAEWLCAHCVISVKKTDPICKNICVGITLTFTVDYII